MVRNGLRQYETASEFLDSVTSDTVAVLRPLRAPRVRRS